MKNTIIVLISLLGCVLSTNAQTKTKWFKTVRKAQAVVYTYNAVGEQIGSCNAVFIGSSGDILTQYDILSGATRAEVVVSTGKKYDVARVIACNSLYNIAHLATTCYDVDGLKIAEADLNVQAPVFIMPALGNAEGILCQNATIFESAKIEDGAHHYYTISGNSDDASISHTFSKNEDCLPVLNETGELVALTQHYENSKKNQVYGVSARFANSLEVSGMSAMKSDYTSLLMQVQLPADESQARTYLYLMPKSNINQYEEAIKQYITAFPENAHGYVVMAELKATQGQNDEVLESYKRGLDLVRTEGRDELLYSQSRYQYALAMQGDKAMLDASLESVRQAYNVVAQLVYRKQEAEVLYSMRRFSEARDIFIECTTTSLRCAEMFVNAAQCVRMMRTEDEESDSVFVRQINALLDSALACYIKPYPAEAASVVWQRAQARHEAGRYREAVTDFNDFEHLVAGRVGAEFYYQRSLSELSGRLYQPALDDAERACQINPNDVQYLVHYANVNIRLGQADKARPLLKRAAELGEPAAQEWLDKHPAE